MARRPLQHLFLSEGKVLGQVRRDELAGWPLTKEVAELGRFLHRWTCWTFRVGRRWGHRIKGTLRVPDAQATENADRAGSLRVFAQQTVCELGVCGGHSDAVRCRWAAAWAGGRRGLLAEYLSKGLGAFLARSAENEAVLSPWVVWGCRADRHQFGFGQRFVCAVTSRQYPCESQ
jgi:hypothetical protein